MPRRSQSPKRKTSRSPSPRSRFIQGRRSSSQERERQRSIAAGVGSSRVRSISPRMRRSPPRMRPSLMTLPPEIGSLIGSYMEPLSALPLRGVRSGRGLGGLPGLPDDVKNIIMARTASQNLVDMLQKIKESESNEEIDALIKEAMKLVRLGADPTIQINGDMEGHKEDLLSFLMNYRKAKDVRELIEKYGVNPNRRIEGFDNYPIFEIMHYLSIFDPEEDEEEEQEEREEDQRNQIQIIKTLIKNGTNINKTDRQGNTVLMNILTRGGVNDIVVDYIYTLVELLLKNGAKTNILNRRGQNALDIAQQQAYIILPSGQKIINLLRKYQ